MNLFDFVSDDTRAGFRLHSFQVFNWGTFHRHVWNIGVQGHNALLTGDIGSGKSTLVDGLTTLLVPSHKITFNKAAGAEGKERSLRSYVQGHYKSEKDDLEIKAKAVALREKNHYSVLLAYFCNEGYATGVTLAQVFWMQDNQSHPNRFFLVADGKLEISEDFAGFGSEITELRKRLRRKTNVTIHENFKDYALDFSRRLGIQNSQALELFYQTVSLKSVGNLTEFIRHHMLEEPPLQERIDELCRDFDNLNRAYEEVQKAKAQIASLVPLVEACDSHAALEGQVRQLRSCREALKAYFADLKVGLLDERIKREEVKRQKLEDKIQEHEQAMSHLRQQESDLRRSLDDQGGRRLEDIKREIRRLGDERDRKSRLAEAHRQVCEALGLPFPTSPEDFYHQRSESENLLSATEAESDRLEAEMLESQMALRTIRERHEALDQEITSLKARRSNIPLPNVRMREQLASSLGLTEEEIPFAGELMRVAESESAWEGAVERLLHQFALSLIVPDRLYPDVAKYVERTHLKGRLVYYRVRETIQACSLPSDPRALVHKLQLRLDNPFHPWLETELARAYDHICAESLEEFQRLPKAVTLEGQVKNKGVRHEKDDRHALSDRSRYVLGWTNQDKIRTLTLARDRLAEESMAIILKLQGDETRRKDLVRRRDSLRDLGAVQDYQEIHWQPIARQILELEAEREQLENTSDTLRLLQVRLDHVVSMIKVAEEQRSTELATLAILIDKLEDYFNLRDEAQQLRDALPVETRNALFPALNSLRPQALSDKLLSVENIDKSQTQMREWVQDRIETAEGRARGVRDSIISDMGKFKHTYPLETQEIDASLEASDEFRLMLSRLQREDLPRHEARFKDLLNERTINGIASLRAQMEAVQDEIREKILTINRSLFDIEYNAGTYIQLALDPTQDTEVRDFQRDLRACLGNTLDSSDHELYAEEKFLQVKALIDRFNGREGFLDADKRWREKVTDVRKWFVFSATERWREDHVEKEFYSDSSGKSGGQKEKLAYTILASALAYQFGLEWGAVRSKSFRFVMIDEAFGRGSDESARYGLELFRKLNLQLLIVTPLQKIHVIEDYVRSVHFVHNEEGRNSKVLSLSLEAYRADKERYDQEAKLIR